MGFRVPDFIRKNSNYLKGFGSMHVRAWEQLPASIDTRIILLFHAFLCFQSRFVSQSFSRGKEGSSGSSPWLKYIIYNCPECHIGALSWS